MNGIVESLKWILCFLPLFAASCFGPTGSDDSGSVDARGAIVCGTMPLVGSSGGGISVYRSDVDSLADTLMLISNDNDVFSFNGDVFVMEKYGVDVITRLPAAAVGQHAIKSSNRIGTGSTNIHALIFIDSTKAYVTAYGGPKLLGFNPKTGLLSGNDVDLSSLAPAATPNSAGDPAMDQGAVYNNKAYIGVQRLDAFWAVSGYSCVAVIDGNTDSLVDTIRLQGKNPQGVSLFGSKLYLACTGAYGANDGGIEVVDCADNTSTGLLVSEADLGGDVLSVKVISATRGYAVITHAFNNNQLVSFNPTSGVVDGVVAAGGNTGDVEYDGVYVYASDRSLASPGLALIDPATNELVRKVEMSVAPNSLVFVP